MIPPTSERLMKRCGSDALIANHSGQSLVLESPRMLVLDTDHLSLLERPDSAERQRLLKRLGQAKGETVVTTIVSDEEQSRGWLAYVARARSKTEQIDADRRLARHLEAYRSLTVLDFDEHAFTK